MGNQTINCLWFELFFELKRFDNFTCLGEYFWLDNSFVRLDCVPFSAYSFTHGSIKLVKIAVWMWQFFEQEFMGEFLVSVFSVKNNSFHSMVCSLLPQFLNFLLLNLLSFLNFLFILSLIYSISCPRVPPSHDLRNLDSFSNFCFGFVLLFLFELLNNFVIILVYEKVFHQVSLRIVLSVKLLFDQLLAFGVETRQIIQIYDSILLLFLVLPVF